MRVRVPVGSLWQYWWSIYSDILQYQYDIYNYCLCVFLIGYLVKMAYLLPLVNRNPWLDPSYDGHSTYSHTESIPCCCQVYYIWWSWHYCMHWHHYELHNYYLNKYCEKNNSIHIYTRRIRILTMMTVAQLTCMEAYCLWMYVIVVYLQLDIVVYLVICIEWLYISQEVFLVSLTSFSTASAKCWYSLGSL